MKKLSLFLIMLVCSLLTYAVPAANVTITHTQKDGTVLTLRLVGDEHMHYYQNVATGQAMQKAADGDFVVISTTEMSTRSQQANLRRTEANKQRISRLPRMQQMNNRPNGPNYSIGNFSSMTGTKKGLVILVNFTDEIFKIGATSTKQNGVTTWDYSGTKTAFSNQFNQQGYSLNGHIGSVKDYFSAQSYGTFTVDFDVVGPVTVSQNMAYYGAPKDKDNDSYPATMVIEACKLADAAGVDFSKYDWNGDGYVDQVFVIYAGYNQAQGASENTIWPHEWNLYSANYFGDGSGPFQLDGKTINTYACTSELAGSSGTTMDGIGTACHEFSHCLGYPDLYDTDGSTNGKGFGMSYYDLMAAGSYNGPNAHGEVPCGYSAYERWMAGWITPTELNADAATISDMVTIDNQTNGGTVLSGNSTLVNSPSRAYIIKNGSDNNYYLLENRPNTGYFKYFHSNNSGSGLFITHVNYDATAWQKNTVNAYADNQRFIPFPADGTLSTSNYTTDFFPTSSVKSFTQVTGKEITNITKSNGLISFDYKGGFNDDGTRYTITLNACGGSVSQNNWTQTSYKQSWTLPEPTTTVVGWEGIGWLTYELTTYKTMDDILNQVINYGVEYTPESNVTLYAVYADDDELCHSRPANYTVNLNAGAGSCSTSSWSQNDVNRSLTLPAATITIDGWTFAGWATENVTETNSAPSTLYAAGDTYKPTSNATLYAVYKKTEKASGDNTFRLSTTLTSGNRYVFVTSNTAGSAYAISKDNLEDISSTNGHTTAGVAINVTDSRTVVPTDAMIWTCTISNEEINLKNGTDYLGINGNGIGKRSSAVSLWWSSDYGLYGKNSKGTTSYYAKVNNSTIQTATTAPTTGRIYAYEAAAAGSDIITYNSNPTPEVTPDPEPGDGGDEPGDGDDDDDDDPVVDIPANYYTSSTLDGKNGQELELALTSIIYTHTKRSYDNLWTDFKTTDPAPLDSIPAGEVKTDLVYDMYSWMRLRPHFYSENDHSQSSARGINREHAVPNSWWGGESGNATAYTDLHHLMPADGAANNMKSNYPLGCGHNDNGSNPTHTTNSASFLWTVTTSADGMGGGAEHVWEPVDEYKGDFARMYLYVVCAYEGNITWQTNYMFTSDGSRHTTIKPWAKDLLLKWHRLDPVSNKERARNNAVYGIQGNRNPFIDYPELAEYIWGNNSSQTFSLSSAQSAYSAEYITANPELTGTHGNGGICEENNGEDPGDDEEPGGDQGDDDPATPATPAPLYFPHIAKLGQPFTAPAFSTNSDGAKTWTSSNTAVATVDNEGRVTIHAVGTTIITVTQAETAQYKQGTASYMIKVVE